MPVNTPFHFAWVDVTETTFGPEHYVIDEEIVSAMIEHTEGDFALLALEVRNPKIGLLAPGRKTWAWFSWFDGTTVIPLFFGRLVGIPDNFNAEVIRLSFSARPADFLAVKMALAETLKVPPFYDPIWIDEGSIDDPDTVLEAYSRLWHIDRVTHELTTSDILVGEDGNEDFLPNEVPYDSVQVRPNQTPIRTVTVDGIVNWGQVASGSTQVFSGIVQTYVGDGLISDWPKDGASIGGGWSVLHGGAVDMDGIQAFQDDDTPEGYKQQLAHMTEPINPHSIPDGWIFVKQYHWQFVTAATEGGYIVPLWRVYGNLELQYDAERDRTEHVRFTMSANVQPIVTLPGEDEVLFLNITSRDVGEPLIENGEIPIVDRSRRSFFPTPRGQQSVEYLIALARANLLMRSRAVEVEWQCRFERAIQLSCRKNARLYDDRLPGGSALGKIIQYTISMDCQSGLIIGTVRIACAIGYGGAVAAEGGVGVYANEGYMNPGYQIMIGQTVVLGSGDISYSIPTEGPNDDGLSFTGGHLTRNDAVTGFTINSTQVELGKTIEEAQKNLELVQTTVSFTVKPVDGGPFETAYDLEVSQLEIPAMINLEAPSS